MIAIFIFFIISIFIVYVSVQLREKVLNPFVQVHFLRLVVFVLSPVKVYAIFVKLLHHLIALVLYLL